MKNKFILSLCALAALALGQGAVYAASGGHGATAGASRDAVVDAGPAETTPAKKPDMNATDVSRNVAPEMFVGPTPSVTP